MRSRRRRTTRWGCSQASRSVTQAVAAGECDGKPCPAPCCVPLAGWPLPVQGVEKLNELVGQAMKEAHSKSVDGMKSRMRQLASNLGMPAPPS